MGILSALFGGLKKKPVTPATPKPQPTTPKQPTPKETYVYVTTKGKKFHYSLACPGIRNSKEVKMALSKARKAGYTACDKCCYSYLHE